MIKAINGSVEGGAALKRHLADIERRLGAGSHLRVGFLESATYPAKHAEAVKKRAKGKKLTVEGKSEQTFQNEYASHRGGLPVATVAFWNEYGTIRTPSRPFFRTMVERKSPRWGMSLGRILKNNDYDAEKSLALMGEGIRGQLRQSIVEWSSPANAKYTVEKKGFNKPLIDTAVMLRSADYQVLAGDGSGDEQ